MSDASRSHAIHDLTLGTYLRSRRHKLLAIQRDGQRSAFIFASTPDLETDILAFYNGETRVEPLSFTELLRSLKAAAMSQAGAR